MLDVVIIGGGIAGVALAAALPARLDVALIEAEQQLGVHATGRSAALYYESYGHPTSIPLASASRPLFDRHGFLRPRGVLTVGTRNEAARIEAQLAQTSDRGARVIDGARNLQRMCSALAGPLEVGLYEPAVADLDVMGVHGQLLAEARQRGAVIHRGQRVIELQRRSGHWSCRTAKDDLKARVIVNASGAWGDDVARLAGVRPIGLRPLRRTAFTVAAPDSAAAWPAVVAVDHSWYFKPEGPQLLCSPAEEVLDEPGDVRPRTEDVAAAIDRINAVTSLAIRSVAAEWTGLRTFAPDGGMVIGFDAEVDGFFWLVGQGGTGIQTAPAAGQLAASLVCGIGMPSTLADAGVEAEAYGVERFRR